MGSWRDLTELTAGRAFWVERVRLEGSDIAIEGSFELPPLAKLPSEDQLFLAAFVRSHGSIKKMEALFGISYPTVKNRLNQIGQQFDFIDIDVRPEAEEEDVVKSGASSAAVLERLERGEITADEAVAQIQKGRIIVSAGRKKILEMLSAGKISADEAERLLDAIDKQGATAVEASEYGGKKEPKFFCVKINGKQGKGERVNVRIPLGLLRAGMKLGALMPDDAKGKVNTALAKRGFDVDLKKLGGDDFDRLVQALTEMCIEVDDDKDHVRICCE